MTESLYYYRPLFDNPNVKVTVFEPAAGSKYSAPACCAFVQLLLLVIFKTRE